MINKAIDIFKKVYILSRAFVDVICGMSVEF